MERTDVNMIFFVKHLDKSLTRSLDKYLEECGLTHQQGRIVLRTCYCYKHNIGLHQNDLEQILQLSKSTISGIVKRLELKGLIYRDKCTHPLLIPTEKALQIEEAVVTNKNEMIKKMLKGISDEEIEICREVGKRIMENLKEIKEE